MNSWAQWCARIFSVYEMGLMESSLRETVETSLNNYRFDGRKMLLSFVFFKGGLI